jgi:chemotaxis protein MotB
VTGSGCVTHRAYRNKVAECEAWMIEAETANKELDELRNLLLEKGERVGELEDLVRLFKENEAMRRKREEEIRKVFRNLEGVEDLAGGGRLSEGVFFRPGSANITAQGQRVLRQIAGRLNHPGVAGYRVTVHGHTDSDPVVVHAKTWTKGNLQLSGARALNVAWFLKQQGVSDKRISFAGHGPNRPVASNRTAAGKAKNRRVEVLLTPYEDSGDIPSMFRAVLEKSLSAPPPAKPHKRDTGPRKKEDSIW